MAIERAKKLYTSLLNSINFSQKNFDQYFKDKAEFDYENLMQDPTEKKIKDYAEKTEKLIGEMKRIGKIYKIYK